MKTLFPPLDPYATYHLKVDSVHCVYVEECGNRMGLPVVFLHGGPASGCRPDHRRFFDPEKYRIVLFDQRGSGRSTPLGEISVNTTQDLVEDMESIRRKMGINRWLVFGGSWGATLALLYASRYLDRVYGLVLRGSFLARQQDLDWFLGNGASRVYPEQWQRLLKCVTEEEHQDLLGGLHRRIDGSDELARRRVAREWDAWGRRVSLGSDFASPETEDSAADLVGKVRVEMHYAVNSYFLRENQVFEDCLNIRGIPIILLHGRYDLVCPVEAGYTLSLALPESRLEVLPNSGHIARGEEMVDALVRATDEMLERVVR
jgi:proline iminopeptidase